MLINENLSFHHRSHHRGWELRAHRLTHLQPLVPTSCDLSASKWAKVTGSIVSLLLKTIPWISSIWRMIELPLPFPACLLLVDFLIQNFHIIIQKCILAEWIFQHKYFCQGCPLIPNSAGIISQGRLIGQSGHRWRNQNPWQGYL